MAALSDRESPALGDQPILVFAPGSDNRPHQAGVTDLLRDEGWHVRLQAAVSGLLAALEPAPPALVVLDVDSRRSHELDACREVRRRSAVPILVAAGTDAEVDAVLALELGADDFVAKSRERELVARVRALLRRATAPAVQAAVLRVGDLMLDVRGHRVELGGRVIELPKKEFELLRTLIEHKGEVLTRDRLMALVWGASYGRSQKTLDAHVKRLRSKVTVGGDNSLRITTVRGVGYRLDQLSIDG